MSAEKPSAPSIDISRYQSLWAQNVCSVLGQISAAAFTFQVLSEEECQKHFSTTLAPFQWVRFTTNRLLSGEQAIRVLQTDAVRFAQLLMGEPLDETAPFSGDYQDALAELMRQFAGGMASSLKEPLGGEVELSLTGMEPPAWSPAAQIGFSVSGPGIPPFLISLKCGPELAESLQRASSANCPEPPSPGPENKATAISHLPSNLKLLLDITLDAHLNFGGHQMLLREVLDCVPGTVVEIDRPIQQPAELWVAGVLMARGETVIVDGNYGLRVTEIASPAERIASLQRISRFFE